MTIRMKIDTPACELRLITPGTCFRDDDGDVLIMTDENTTVVLLSPSGRCPIGTTIGVNEDDTSVVRLVELIVSEVRDV